MPSLVIKLYIIKTKFIFYEIIESLFYTNINEKDIVLCVFCDLIFNYVYIRFSL